MNPVVYMSDLVCVNVYSYTDVTRGREVVSLLARKIFKISKFIAAYKRQNISIKTRHSELFLLSNNKIKFSSWVDD
jgi:hypothetical protein